MTDQRRSIGKDLQEGFSLLEVLMAMMIVVVVAIALMQLLGTGVALQERSDQIWREAVQSWNEIQEIRSGDRPSEIGHVQPRAEMRPLQRAVISSRWRNWEVLLDE